ncbi:MAG: SufB/SufD family protein [bacterium]
MIIKEIYEKTPIPLKTEHTWRYSEYSFFTPNKEPKTAVKLSANITTLKEDLFKPLTLKYPEKIALHNLIYNPEKFSLKIDKNGLYEINQQLLGEYNFERIQIKIEENLDVDLILNTQDSIKNSVNNNVIEIWACKNAKIRILFDNSLTNSYTHNFIYLNIGDNSDLRLAFLTFNPKYEKTQIRSLINGINSNYVVYILAKVDNTEHVDYRTENIHLKSNSKSLSVYRSVANGKSRSIYTGMLRIEKEAKYCNAYQNSRNILLSEKAKIETIPELEILNQEVACTHGAVISSVDEESIYYFMSRGVSREEAIKLLIDGFLLDKLEENFGPKIYPIIYKKVTNQEYE